MPLVAQPAASGPRLELDTTEIDLGRVDMGTTAEAKFALKNAGDETLVILKAKPG